MADRPSYILFITDQQRYDHLGCNGHPVLNTPHIDAIAEEGVNYDRFYVASPVCMPNRASLMTCRMPSSHGVRSLGIPLHHDNVTFVELLRASQILVTRTQEPFIILTIVGAFYFMLSYPIARITDRLEKRWQHD